MKFTIDLLSKTITIEGTGFLEQIVRVMGEHKLDPAEYRIEAKVIQPEPKRWIAPNFSDNCHEFLRPYPISKR